MPSFGETLRRARESRDIPLHEISLATRISEGHLEALESNDLKALPGTVFNKGYVRAYAEYLEIDPGPLLDAYAAEESAQASRGQVPESPDVLEALRKSVDRSRGSDRGRGWPTGLLVGVAAAIVVIVLGWFLGRDLFSGGDADAGDGTSPAAVTAPADAGPADTAAPPERETFAGEDRSPQEEATPSAEQAATPVLDEPPPARPAASPRAEDVEAAPAATPEPAAPAPAASPPGAPSPVSPAPTIEEPTPAATGEPTLAIPEHGVGTALVDRNLAGRGDRFAPGTEVIFWTRVTGGSRGDTVRHVWLHDGKAVGSVALRIGGSHWRTNSRRRVSATGSWAVEARDEAGRVLARDEFVCR